MFFLENLHSRLENIDLEGGKICFIELFRKNSSYVSGLSVCLFVALWARDFVC